VISGFNTSRSLVPRLFFSVSLFVILPSHVRFQVSQAERFVQDGDFSSS
jgi:hypothetical protein